MNARRRNNTALQSPTPSAYAFEQALITGNRDFLRKIIDLDPNLIFVKDRYGRFILVNQAIAILYGAPVDEIEGRTDADFNSSPEEVAHFRRDDLRVLRGEELFVPEESVTDAQGKVRYLQTWKRPLRLEGSSETYVLGVATDITEQRVLREQLALAQKHEALGKLAGGVAHDFNNLLTAMLGYIGLLKMQRREDPEVFRLVELLDGTAGAASDLTKRLLNFARARSGERREIDLNDLIRETLRFVNQTIEPSAALTTSLCSERLLVMADPIQIQQIILNLLMNARDAVMDRSFSEGRGSIILRTARTSRPLSTPGECELHRPEYAHLAVIDNGCGIPSDQIDKIWEPFFTTKASGRGTGLGLATVYGIVHDHGGSVEVRSTVGQGSEFLIFLPLSCPHSPKPNE